MQWSGFKRGLVFVGFIVLGIIAAVALFFYQAVASQQVFAPGVQIAGVPVQGKSCEEASSLLAAKLDRLWTVPVEFYREDYTYECTMRDLCEPIDIKGFVKDVWDKEQHLDWKEKLRSLDGRHYRCYSLTLNYDAAVKDKLHREWNERWSTPYTDARVIINAQGKPEVLPGQIGTRVDINATYMYLPQELKEMGELSVLIALESVNPHVNPEDFRNLGQLAVYSTQYNAGEVNRSHNLHMAASSIDNCILKAGEVFSFNKRVGSRSSEKGYRDAMVVVGDKFEPGIGGGICQVSSTLYNSVLLAGLEIVERHNHGLSVSYVPLGRDATVVYGVQDFRFRNNTDSPLCIKANAAGGKLTITIYGNTDYKKNIRVYAVIDKTIPYDTVTEADKNLAPGTEIIERHGLPGYVVRAFRQYTDARGKIVKTERLGTDCYKPLSRVIKKGPAHVADPAVPDPPAPAPGEVQEPGAGQNPPDVGVPPQVPAS